MLPDSDGSHSPKLGHFYKLVVCKRSGAAEVWLVAAFKFVTMSLMGFFLFAGEGVVGFQCYGLQSGQDSCSIFASLGNGEHRRVERAWCLSFLVVLSSQL